MKNWVRYSIFSLIFILIAVGIFGYFLLVMAGKSTYELKAKQVHILVKNYPNFFQTIYNDIFPSALSCQQTREECSKMTREKFDQLSASVKASESAALEIEMVEKRQRLQLSPSPSNEQPVYFITLLPDGKIAKLFFSGELKLEEVDTREERMVVEVLEGTRKELYGPYFNSEVFEMTESNVRPMYDPKPAYLKDFYGQMEVIVPYYQDGKIIGAIVHLHGE
jgi:hypothetical protein